MRKMFGIVVVLLTLYIVIQIIYSYAGGRQTNSYEITVGEDKYQVKEVFNSKNKSLNSTKFDETSYFYEIKSNSKLLFSFKILGDYNNAKRLIKNLLFYKNDVVTCVYPVFKLKVKDVDIICKANDLQYLYGSLENPDNDLYLFILSLKTKGYNHPSWSNEKVTPIQANNIRLYDKNVTDNQNIAIWQYEGIYRITNRSKETYTLNKKDQYDPILATMVDQYYVIPNYDGQYSFDQIYTINLISGEKKTINLSESVAYDSFVQGVVDDEIYIVDLNKKVQYAINIYNKTIKTTGNTNSGGKFYENGKWTKKSLYEIIDNKLVFSNETPIPDFLNQYNPLYIGQVGGETDGYYYLYIKENGQISVYRIDKQKTDVLTQIFTVPSINRIKYQANSIYFISNDTLYMYADNIGLKPLIIYNEFIFNKSDLYNIYIN